MKVPGFSNLRFSQLPCSELHRVSYLLKQPCRNPHSTALGVHATDTGKRLLAAAYCVNHRKDSTVSRFHWTVIPRLQRTAVPSLFMEYLSRQLSLVGSTTARTSRMFTEGSWQMDALRHANFEPASSNHYYISPRSETTALTDRLLSWVASSKKTSSFSVQKLRLAMVKKLSPIAAVDGLLTPREITNGVCSGKYSQHSFVASVDPKGYIGYLIAHSAGDRAVVDALAVQPPYRGFDSLVAPFLIDYFLRSLKPEVKSIVWRTNPDLNPAMAKMATKAASKLLCTQHSMCRELQPMN